MNKKGLAAKAVIDVVPEVSASWTSEYPLLVATALAVAVPLMWGYQQPPLPAFYSQVAACALWCVVLLASARALLTALRASNTAVIWSTAPALALCALWATLLGLTLVHGALTMSPLFAVAPVAFNLTLAGLITVAVLVVGQDEVRRGRWLAALLVGILLAALFNSFVALLQTFAPNWTDDVWIASSAPPHDRVSGNLRQPNQLATLMVWGLLAATFLLRRVVALWIAVSLPLIATLLATGSRTGVISLALIVIVALLASRRVRTWRKRTWLGLALVALLLAWIAAGIFSRNTAGAALSQRLALWHDVVALMQQHPWLGVGVGQLNFAWTLTPLAARAPDVFDHAHSLPLHLAAEMGVPAALLIFSLLAFVLWRTRAALRTRAGATAALLLAVMFIHSLFEYPLWFSYFFLPTAFLLTWLVCAAATNTTRQKNTNLATPKNPGAVRLAIPAALAVIALSLMAALYYAVSEYDKASAIHRRTGSSTALTAAVEKARASPLFGQFGDYAAIILAGDNAPLAWFDRPIRNVLDERLLAAYAGALARSGDNERAAHVVARAREFPPNQLFAGLPVVVAPASAASSPLGPRDFRR